LSRAQKLTAASGQFCELKKEGHYLRKGLVSKQERKMPNKPEP